MKLVTSNMNKLAEFNGFGAKFAAEVGRDLPEVDADPITVAVYKALAAGVGCAVEDTSLDVDSADVGINVRWLIDSMMNTDEFIGRAATWRVLIAANFGSVIRVYSGETCGRIVSPRGCGFGFDPIFEINGKTLAEMGSDKTTVSARRLAAENWINNYPSLVVQSSDIPVWTGKFQH